MVQSNIICLMFFSKLTTYKIWSCIQQLCSSGFIPWSWKLRSTKSLHTDVITALFRIAKTWKQLRCPAVGEGINKLDASRPWDIIHCQKELLSHEKIWIQVKWLLLRDKSQSEKAAYCLIPTIGHFVKDKNVKTVKRSVIASGWGRKGRTSRIQRNYRAVKIQWYYNDGYMSLFICPTHRMYNSDPKINYELWMIFSYQCSFIKCNKCTPLLKDNDNGEGYVCWGQELHGKSLYLPLNFYMNRKLL